MLTSSAPRARDANACAADALRLSACADTAHAELAVAAGHAARRLLALAAPVAALFADLADGVHDAAVRGEARRRVGALELDVGHEEAALGALLEDGHLALTDDGSRRRDSGKRTGGSGRRQGRVNVLLVMVVVVRRLHVARGV